VPVRTGYPQPHNFDERWYRATSPFAFRTVREYGASSPTPRPRSQIMVFLLDIPTPVPSADSQDFLIPALVVLFLVIALVVIISKKKK